MFRTKRSSGNTDQVRLARQALSRKPLDRRNFGCRPLAFKMRSVCLANRRFAQLWHMLATSVRPTMVTLGLCFQGITQLAHEEPNEFPVGADAAIVIPFG